MRLPKPLPASRHWKKRERWYRKLNINIKRYPGQHRAIQGISGCRAYFAFRRDGAGGLGGEQDLINHSIIVAECPQNESVHPFLLLWSFRGLWNRIGMQICIPLGFTYISLSQGINLVNIRHHNPSHPHCHPNESWDPGSSPRISGGSGFQLSLE